MTGGLTYDVRREDWLAGDTWMSSPSFPAWSAIDLVIIHWPGGNGVPVSGNPDDVLRFVRNQQSWSRSSRGYNLGYSTSVDWLGRRIEIRGDRNRNAANAPAALNARSVSIQVLVNLDGRTTAAQDDGIRDLVAQVFTRAPVCQVIPHRDGPQFEAGATATACCGDLLAGRVHNGDFNPGATPTPPRPPQPDPEDPVTDDEINRIAAEVMRRMSAQYGGTPGVSPADGSVGRLVRVEAAVNDLPNAVWRRAIPLRTGASGETRQAAELLGWAHANAEQANQQIVAHRGVVEGRTAVAEAPVEAPVDDELEAEPDGDA